MNKKISFVVVIVFIIILVFLLKQTKETPRVEVPKEESTESSQILITNKEIKEENFTGNTPTIIGESKLAIEARTYVEQAVSQFKSDADVQVPDMRREFGRDTPTANYTIDIQAKHLKGDKTESVVISTYAYTGGANGNSSYKVITALVSSGEILVLSDVIKVDKKIAFTELLKKELKNWRIEGNTESMLFLDVVDDLSFENITNWSLDGENLYIYFSKYEIGPGVLGAFVFPIGIEKVKDLIEPSIL